MMSIQTPQQTAAAMPVSGSTLSQRAAAAAELVEVAESARHSQTRSWQG
jgi:hypothetical protein